MTAWNPMKDMPADRAVLMASRQMPFGHKLGVGYTDLTIHIGHRGNGAETGIWSGNQFFPDRKVRPFDISASVFCGWADVPAFDLEV